MSGNFVLHLGVAPVFLVVGGAAPQMAIRLTTVCRQPPPLPGTRTTAERILETDEKLIAQS